MNETRAVVALYVPNPSRGNGYGLLRPEGAQQTRRQDILFYESEWTDTASVPAVGDRVACQLRPIPDGRIRAYRVRLLPADAPLASARKATLAEIERLAAQRPELRVAAMTWRVLRQRDSGSGKHQLRNMKVVNAGNGIFWSASTKRNGGEVYLMAPPRVLDALRGSGVKESGVC